MKVKDLIEYLETLDGEDDVYVSDGVFTEIIEDVHVNVIMYGEYIKEVKDKVMKN